MYHLYIGMAQRGSFKTDGKQEACRRKQQPHQQQQRRIQAGLGQTCAPATLQERSRGALTGGGGGMATGGGGAMPRP